jgi:hypothetical protein
LWLKEEPYPEEWRVNTDANDEVVTDDQDELTEDLGADDETAEERPTIKLIALKSIRRQEVEVAKVFEGIRKLDDLPAPLPDWKTLLIDKASGGFGEPQTQREIDAVSEKVLALETLFSQRICVLTGGAGTGKTSVLKVFLRVCPGSCCFLTELSEHEAN